MLAKQLETPISIDSDINMFGKIMFIRSVDLLIKVNAASVISHRFMTSIKRVTFLLHYEDMAYLSSLPHIVQKVQPDEIY